jgi:hypothetical protein
MRALPKGSALRFATIEEVFYNNLLIRLWCFRCFRWEMMKPEAMQRSWKRQLGRIRPRCKHCRKSDQTRALPASDPDWQLSPPDKANSQLVEQFFHGQRSLKKRRR